jgi:beta-glucosidase
MGQDARARLSAVPRGELPRRIRGARGRLVAGLAVTAAALTGAGVAQAAEPVYQDTSYSFRERATDLVSRMTLAEKASQAISSRAPGIPRLGVRPYGWWNEALHGVSRITYNDAQNATTLVNTTSYPIDQSLGSTWDEDLVHRVAAATSDEAREVVPDNTLDLDFYSPTMNLERDPRWGRNDEAYAEDPLLTSRLVSQFVNGMEGKGEDGKLPASAKGYAKTQTTIKHYVANNSEVNRLRGSSNMDDRTLREYYTKAFRDVIKASDPGSVMSSYNRVNGTPVTTDPYVLSDLLRKTFGFGGYVSSDCDAIYGVTANHQWQPANMNRPLNPTERHAYALTAGTDLDCNAGYKDAYNYKNQLPTAITSGIPTLTDTLNQGDLDLALVRLFTARMQLGEFDDPSGVPWVTQARDRLPAGTWTNDESNAAVTQTPERLALAREAADKSLVLLKNTSNLLPLNVPTSGAYKVLVVGALANPPSTATTKGYLGGYSSNQGPAGQANIVPGYQGLHDAILAKNPDATVDYQRGFTGSGTTAASLTSVDPAAVTAAQTGGYNAVVVYTGTDGGTANEDVDRAAITLPGAQGDLINQIAAVNPNTIAYMETIGPMDVTPFVANVKALLWSSYNGQRKGEALADIILGKTSPSGRLPSTWTQTVDQLPSVTDYNIRPSAGRPGRTGWYFAGPVQYPFGFGLSYTAFSYSAMQLSDTDLDANDTLEVSFDVTNTGATAGQDTPQVYVSTPDADPAKARPIKRLEGFEKVTLGRTDNKTVTIRIPIRELAFYDQATQRWTVDPGRYRIEVGRSLTDIVSTRDVQVHGTIAKVPAVVTADPAMSGDAQRDVATRVSYPVGATIDPRLTVAYADDTLVGYIRKGESEPLPASLSTAFTSNRPSVVQVGAGGTLKAAGPGIATITATATDGGVSRTGTFTVRVDAQLTGLLVGGQALAATTPGKAFDPAVYDYDVVVGNQAPGAPVITATSGDPGATVTVDQAGGVPGVATVDVTGSDGVAYAYRVHLARPAVGDDFAKGVVGPQWQTIRPDDTKTPAASGAYKIIPDTGDLAGATNTARNLLVQRASGDWTVETRAAFAQGPTINGQQAGLIAYEGDDDYLKVGWEFSSGAARLTVVSEEDRSGVPVTQTLANVPTAAIIAAGTQNRTLWLRMTKQGTRYTASYSVNGSTWTDLYELGASLRDVRVGVYGYSGAAGAATGDFQVSFQGIKITNPGPAPTPPEGGDGPDVPGGDQPVTGASGGGPQAGAGAPAPPVGPPAPPVKRATAPARPSIAATTLSADRRRQVAVRIKCAATRAGRCTAVVRLDAGKRLLARRTVTVPAGKLTTVRLTLTPQAYRALVRAGRQRVSIRMQTQGSPAQSATRTTTLRAPKGA